jgi:hypothetical protein
MLGAHRTKIIELAKTGKPPREIKRALPPFIRIEEIYDVIREARKREELIPRFTTRGEYRGHLPVRVSRKTINALKPAAEQRGIQVMELVRLLLDQIAEDDLTNSILDD